MKREKGKSEGKKSKYRETAHERQRRCGEHEHRIERGRRLFVAAHGEKCERAEFVKDGVAGRLGQGGIDPVKRL